MLAVILSISLMFSAPKHINTIPVTIYTTESITETETEVTIETNDGNLYAFYSDTDEWKQGEKADVTMIGDCLVHIERK